MRVVVDTNVIVSALLKAGSVPDRALSAILASATVLYDGNVLAEYRAVLKRPKFENIDQRRIDAVITSLQQRGTSVGHVPPWEGPMRDASDAIFIAVAIGGRADAVVTGNIKDYPTELGFEVLPPATVLARIEDA